MPGAARPATFLDATHVKHLRLASIDHHRARSDPVLLAALEQLALQNQRGAPAVVRDDQLGDDGVTSTLFDRQLGCSSLTRTRRGSGVATRT